MTAELVIAGRHGCAARHTVTDGRTVAAWTLRPMHGDPASLTEGDPVELLAMHAARGIHNTYAVVLAGVDRSLADHAHRLGLPRELGYQVHLVEALPVHTVADARQLAEQLARQAITGALPLPPSGDDGRAVWRAVITALASALHQPRPGFRPGHVAAAPT